LRGFGESVVGIDLMAYAAQSLGWAKAAQTYGSRFFGNGGQLQAVIQSKRALSPEALAALRIEWRARMSGGGDGPAFLDADMEYKPIAIEPEKGQFLETQIFLLTEACRWIGVPPHKIYDLSHATFTNIEHQNIEVVEDALRPWTKRLQDEADYKLLGQNRQNYESCIDLESLTRADTTARMAYYQGLRNVGALNANEIRESEGIAPIGDAGEKYTMQSGMTTLEMIGEKPDPAPAPADPAPELGDPAPADPAPELGDPVAYAELLDAIRNAGGKIGFRELVKL
jgi:HK97 family phage portal protein